MTVSDTPDDELFDEDNHSNNFAAFRQFLRNKLWALKVHNYKTKNIRSLAKFLRRKLNFSKTPKKKGYGQYFTEEERRYNTIP